MLQIPRIAFFTAEEKEHQDILPLFSQFDFSLRQVEYLSQIKDLILEEGAPFDCILIPSLLADGTPANSLCSQIRADSELKNTAIVVLNLEKQSEEQGIAAHYQAGADFVFSRPFDGSILYYQIVALNRIYTSIQSGVNEVLYGSLFESPFLASYDTLRDGLLVFDPNLSCKFVNDTGKLLLGVKQDHALSHEALSRVLAQFQPYLKEHRSRSLLSSPAKNTGEGGLGTQLSLSLQRRNETSFRAILNISSLTWPDGKLGGYVVSFRESSFFDSILASAEQDQRVRSLALMSSYAALDLLDQLGPELKVSPLEEIDNFVSKIPNSCALGDTVSFLLHLVDDLIDPTVVVKIDLDESLTVAMNPAHVFQIAGLLLLTAADFISGKGEIALKTTNQANRNQIIMEIASVAHEPALFFEASRIPDELAESFPEEYLRLLEVKHLGVNQANQLAQLYNSSITYRQDSQQVLRLRVALPIKKGSGP